jgi:hypothetical protein
MFCKQLEILQIPELIQAQVQKNLYHKIENILDEDAMANSELISEKIF